MAEKDFWQKRELVVLLCCFAAAFMVNVYAVIRYESPWTEIFTQIGYVAIFCGILYVLTVIFRLLAWLISLTVRKIRRHRLHTAR